MNTNPSDTNDVIGEYAQASSEQVSNALTAANRAVGEWGVSPMETRYQVLMAIGNELIERSAELGELLAREEGKTRAEGVGEVYRSGQFFHYFAAEVHRQIDDRADSVRPGVEIETRREPVGVVAIISPWNFPMATAVWKIAPALAFGNAVIFKPANLVPAGAWALTEIISRQACPMAPLISSWAVAVRWVTRSFTATKSTRCHSPVRCQSANRLRPRPQRTW